MTIFGLFFKTYFQRISNTYQLSHSELDKILNSESILD